MTTRSKRKRTRPTRKKRQGGKISMATVVVTNPNQTTTKLIATSTPSYDEMLLRAIKENNQKILKRFAVKLIHMAIPANALNLPIFKFGPITMKEFLIQGILATWKKEKHVSFDILVRSAKHHCTHEIINDALYSLARRVDDFYKDDEPINISINNVEQIGPIYQRFMQNMDKIPSVSMASFQERVALTKYGTLRHLSMIIALGFMEINSEWFDPPAWLQSRTIPTVPIGKIDRLLCKKTAAERRIMSMDEKKTHANQMVRELLGPAIHSMSPHAEYNPYISRFI